MPPSESDKTIKFYLQRKKYRLDTPIIFIVSKVSKNKFLRYSSPSGTVLYTNSDILLSLYWELILILFLDITLLQR